MSSLIALLRAVNLAGANRVPMPELRATVEGLGFQAVRTLLASGNVVFAGRPQPDQTLESKLAAALKKRLGVATDFFVRTAREWKGIVDANPFPDEASDDPAHLLVLFMRDAPGAKRLAGLQAAIKGREQVRGAGRHAYLVYPDGIGRSKLTMAVIEKALETRGTARNWNTVLKLQKMAEAAD
jgi:uncharacterized protein (DUF1697 family)